MSTKFLFTVLLFPACLALVQAQTGTALTKNSIQKRTFNKIENHDWNHEQSADDHNPCQVFIGVGTTPQSGGLQVDYTVENTPARSYDVQVGDLILAFDEVPVSTYAELMRERNKHQPGDAFTLNITRNGNPMTIKARFKTCSQEEKQAVQRKEAGLRPILGIYEKEESDRAEGLVIGEIIPGKGAAMAGLQADDIITSVDEKAVSNISSLQRILASHQPGDQVTVVYQREGQSQQLSLTLSGDRHAVQTTFQRDPCAVFIGVYTTDNGTGVRVTDVIENTPAKESAMQPGDVILALDDQPVNTYADLSRERDKHQPGDEFRMKVQRGAYLINVRAKFKACPQGPVTEPVKIVPEPSLAQPERSTGLLEVTALDLYPNPTRGLLNLRLEAAAMPTTIRISDATGRIVYENVLRQFPGTFQEQISLEDQTPGIYTVTVQQDKKVLAKTIVLLARL